MGRLSAPDKKTRRLNSDLILPHLSLIFHPAHRFCGNEQAYANGAGQIRQPCAAQWRIAAAKRKLAKKRGEKQRKIFCFGY